MAGLCWMAVTLVVFLSTENSLADVDQNQLATFVQEVLNRYRPSYSVNGRPRFPMFSVAVSVPYDPKSKMYDINLVPDSGEQVRNEILNCNVYKSRRVVAATVLRWPNVVSQCPQANVQWPDVLRKCPKGVKTWADVKTSCPRAVNEGKADHAEFRTLQQLNTLVHSENDFLLFYVLASPCEGRCTNERNPLNILNKITEIKNWRNYAVVFSNIFKPREGGAIPEENLRESLARLGTKIGLNRIYRCNEQGPNKLVQCTSCSDGEQVTRYCYSDKRSAGRAGG
ncbi:uncharacterized protein LOC121180385 [Toxotes jaculatrix]|uniref:uncharacterized protein LOC121180385 n=1 Tax=Toxotes jaculatrix TaxID=941984 RepID=UPI001B3ABBDF|nr:uncharacterized protein LOC121180385 [Toxotes jaculatrix]